MRLTFAVLGIFLGFCSSAFADSRLATLEKIQRIACQADQIGFELLLQDTRRSSLETLTSLVEELEREHPKINQTETAQQSRARLEIANCARQTLRRAFQTLKSSTLRLSTERINRELYLISRLEALNSRPLQRYHYQLNSSKDPRDLELRLKGQSDPVTVNDIFAVIAAGDLDFAEQLMDRLSEEILVPSVERKIQEFAAQLQSYNFSDRALDLALFAAIHALHLNGSRFDQVGVRQSIEYTQSNIKLLTERELKQVLEESLSQLQPFANGLDYSAVRKQIYTAFRARGIPETKITAAFAASQQRLETGFSANGILVREGDILLTFEDQGWGDVMASIIGLKALFNHSSLVTTRSWGPIKTYLNAEVLGGRTIQPLTQLKGTVVVRFNDSLANRTSELLKEFTSRPVLFDSQFKDGLFNLGGKKFSLYCSEFIHYAFKNGLKPDGVIRPSPFDSVSFQLQTTNPVLAKNMSLLGLHLNSKMYLPDQLFFNPNTSLIAVAPIVSEESADPTTTRYIDELSERFNQEIARRLAQSPLRPIGWIEKTQLAAKAKMAEMGNLALMLKSIDLPAGDAWYYFFKFISLYDHMENFKPDRANPDESERILTPERRAEMTARFEKDVLPKINELFH